MKKGNELLQADDGLPTWHFTGDKQARNGDNCNTPLPVPPALSSVSNVCDVFSLTPIHLNRSSSVCKSNANSSPIPDTMQNISWNSVLFHSPWFYQHHSTPRSM
ncbi:hypothetical protein CBL_03234 [Carabus blaptoides fortunei]